MKKGSQYLPTPTTTTYVLPTYLTRLQIRKSFWENGFAALAKALEKTFFGSFVQWKQDPFAFLIGSSYDGSPML